MFDVSSVWCAGGPTLVQEHKTTRCLYSVGDEVKITQAFRASKQFCVGQIGTIKKIVKPDPSSRCKEFVMWVKIHDPFISALVETVNGGLGESVHPEFAENDLVLCKKSGLEVQRTVSQIAGESLGRRSRGSSGNGEAGGAGGGAAGGSSSRRRRLD